MRPLTDRTPKPLLPVAGKPLLQYHLEALARAGFTELTINHARFGSQIEARFGNGGEFGVNIRYSPEGDRPLETGGGIKRALPLLGEEPFLTINGDIWSDFPLAKLAMAPAGQAHLVLAPNPAHRPDGDFALEGPRVSVEGQPKHTFTGIAVYRPALFAAARGERFSIVPLLRKAMAAGQVTGELHRGRWFDIGTPERLAALERLLAGG